MVKEIKDEEIDFTDLSAIKTPEQHEAFRIAAADAREKLLALDTPENDSLGDMIDAGKDAAPQPAPEKKVEEKPEAKPEEKKPEEKNADEPIKKDEPAAAPVDDDLKALSPEAQKLVMDARAAVVAAKKDADDAKAVAAEESKRLTEEFEGKQTETLKLSEVNQDRAGYAQVVAASNEIDMLLEKKESEFVDAQEAGDTKKAAALTRELSRMEWKKQQIEQTLGLYGQKYGVTDKGVVNFRALDTKAEPAKKTEVKPVVTEEKKDDAPKTDAKGKPAPSKEAIDQMTAWHTNNKAVLGVAAPEVMQSIGKLADMVAEMYGLKTETPEFYDELNRAVKAKHGLELVGSKKPVGKLQDIPSTVAEVDRTADSKADESKVVVTARQRKMRAEAGKDPNDPVWLKAMAEVNKQIADQEAAEAAQG